MCKNRLDEVTKYLGLGGVVIFPTDTIYALACAEKFPEALDRIFEIKRRPLNKQVALMFPSLDTALDRIGSLTIRQIGFMDELLPGPVTFVVHSRYGSEEKNIGIRVPASATSETVMRGIWPLYATSVNLSGQLAAVRFDEIAHEIVAKVDAYWEDDFQCSGIASTVIDMTLEDPLVVRQGSISVADIKRLWDKLANT